MNESKKNCMAQLQWLLALLRAQYWTYQNLHWESQGPNFYGNHLLFQRIYEGMPEQVDGLAEKMVSVYGKNIVCSCTITDLFMQWMDLWKREKEPFQRALYSEKCAHACIKRTYDMLKKYGELTLGMDDYLMSLDSQHETHDYLLRQVLRTARPAAPEWEKMSPV